MGVLYVVVPFDAAVAESLSAYDVVPPPGVEEGRLPTRKEIDDALASMDGLSVERRSTERGTTWHCEATNDDQHWATVSLSDDGLSFEKGWPDVNLEIVRQL